MLNPPLEFPFRLIFGLSWLAFLISRLYFQKQIKSGKEYTVINGRKEKLLFLPFMLAFILLPLYFFSFLFGRLFVNYNLRLFCHGGDLLLWL